MRAPLLFAALSLPSTALGQVTADLTTQSVTLGPATVQVGTQLTVSGSFVDQGGTHLGVVAYRIVMSSDPMLDPGDTQLDEGLVTFTQSMTPVAFNTTFAMPPAAPGTYTIFAEVDWNQMVTEADETNNAAAAATLLTYQGADLRVDGIEGPAYAFAGGSYTIDLTIENAGPIPADDFRYVYYYSDTPHIRVFSQPLGTFGPVSVPAGGLVSFSDTLTLPTSTTAGGYIGVIIDQFGEVPDSNIGNNIGRIPHEVAILPPSPDLSARIVETSEQAATGEQFVVTRTMENTGIVDATFEYAYFLSTDATVSRSDIRIETFTGALPAGGDDYVIDLMNVPYDTPPGTYYLGLIVDPDDAIEEPIEEDNIALGPQLEVFESAIRFTTQSLPDATLGVPYEVGVYATGPLEISFSVSGGQLPDGLSLGQDGILSGVPSQSGLFEVTIRANSGSALAERLFSIQVLEPTVPLEVVPIRLHPAVAGRHYETRFVAVGGQSPFTFASLSDLPIGLTLAPDGTLTGTPQVVGDHPFTIEVTDAVGNTALREFHLSVITADESLYIVQQNLPSAVVGTDYCDASTIQLEAANGSAPYRWRTVGDAPPGMTVSESGELCGTPLEVGSFPFTVRVEDQTGFFDTSLVVLDVVSETTFGVSTTTLPEGEVGAAYDYLLEVWAGDAPFRWEAIPGAGDLPPGLSVSEDGRITGTPTETGVFAFVVHVVDGKNRADTQPLSIAVVEAGTLSQGPGAGCGCSAAREGTHSFGLVGLLLLFLVGRRRTGR